MSQAIVTESKLVAIADAIRSQTGGTTPLTLDQMASEIANISGGGGGSNDLYDYIMGTLSVVDLSIPYVPASAFISKTAILEANLPNASYVGSSAFFQCNYITSVNLPNCSILSTNAFANCQRLPNINMPNITTLYSRAFWGCFSLTNSFVESVINKSTINIANASGCFYDCSNLTSINYYNSAKLPDGMFSSCRYLEFFNAPSVTSLGSGMFYNCTKLSYVSFPELLSTSASGYYYATFYQCNFKYLDFSKAFPKLEYVASSCFYYLSYSSYVELPKATYMGQQAFYRGGGMYDQTFAMSFPELISAGSACFSGNTSLYTFYAPKLQYIGSNCFSQESRIRRLDFPTAISINSNAFNGCSRMSLLNLQSVSSVPYLQNANAFYATPMSNSTYLGYFGSIYVPSSLYTAFIASTNWVTYSARITSDPCPIFSYPFSISYNQQLWAEPSMTWNDWISTSYNSLGFTISDYVYYGASKIAFNSVAEVGSNYIIPERIYSYTN